MTWFQLVEAQLEKSEPSRTSNSAPLAPNSALFFNPSLPLRPAAEPVARPSRPHLRLIKGAQIHLLPTPTAA